jgi:DNA-binding CsgD family transcriptional regulator
MTVPPSTRAKVALMAIEQACGAGLDAQELLEEVTPRIVEVTEAEAFFVGATDPETGMCMGAGMVYGMSDQICAPFWDHEFNVPDFNKFSDLTPQTPVGDLHAATGGRLERSARWRAFHAISDLDGELRMAMHAGGRQWGLMQLNRLSGGPRFDAEHRAFLEQVAPMLGAALRDALLTRPASASSRGPGVIVLDECGIVTSATPEAEAWLEELRTDWSSFASGLPVPLEVYSLALTTARERAKDGDVATRRARMRTTHGVWLLIHSSRLGDTGQVAMVIEPAKASEVAPIIIEAYGLTVRELEVTRMVARGHKTSEIGAALHLSPHTVRDYIKSVFEKVGVSSRGELVSKLFAEHYHDDLDAAVTGSEERVAARVGA